MLLVHNNAFRSHETAKVSLQTYLEVARGGVEPTVTGMKTQRLNRLTNGPFALITQGYHLWLKVTEKH